MDTLVEVDRHTGELLLVAAEPSDGHHRESDAPSCRDLTKSQITNNSISGSVVANAKRVPAAGLPLWF